MRLFIQTHLYLIVVLTSIALLGFILRSHGASSQISFAGRDAVLLSQIFDIETGGSNEEPIHPASYPSWVTTSDIIFTHGKFHTLLLKKLLPIVHFRPSGLVAIWILADTVTIIFVFWAASVAGVWAGLIAGLLYAVCWIPIFHTRLTLGFSLIPLFVSLSLGSVFRLVEGKERFWPLLVFSTLMIPHIHNVGYFYTVIIVITCVVWKITLPRSHVNRFLTFLALTPFFMLALWDFSTIQQLVTFVEQLPRSSGWRTLIGALRMSPLDMYTFLAVFTTGPSPLRFILVPTSLFALLLGFAVSWSMFEANKQRTSRKIHIPHLRMTAWLLSLVIFFLVTRHWYHGSPFRQGYGMDILVIVVMWIIVESWSMTLLLRNPTKTWFWVGILTLVMILTGSTSATEQLIWQDRTNIFTFGKKQAVLNTIQSGLSGKPAVICATMSDQDGVDDLSYLWKLNKYPPNVRFTTPCSREAEKGITYVVIPKIYSFTVYEEHK